MEHSSDFGVFCEERFDDEKSDGGVNVGRPLDHSHIIIP